MARGSSLVARGSWLVARGSSRLVARASWLVPRGSWELAPRGSWLVGSARRVTDRVTIRMHPLVFVRIAKIVRGTKIDFGESGIPKAKSSLVE